MAPIVVARSLVLGGRDGAIAQLGERVVRNDEVGGSIPPGSTSLPELRLGKPAWLLRSEGREGCLAIARRATAGSLHKSPYLPPRKPRRPFLHEARHTLAEITAVERDQHLAIGFDRGLGQRLERHLVELPLDHGHRARRDEI